MNIAVFSIRRGGGHPVINWICRQLPGFTVHYNNIFKAGGDPYKRSTHIINYQDGGAGEEMYNTTFRQRRRIIAETVRPPEQDSDHVVHTYEDFQLRYLKSHGYYDRFEDVRPIEVLILRDPYNCSASRIISRRHAFLNRWVWYAREFVGETDLLKFDKRPINYNSWFMSRKYRDSWLLENFGLENHDWGVDEVSGMGNGSSFSGQTFDGQAQRMDVLNRWKEIGLENNKTFRREMRENPKAREFAKKIFHMEFPSC